MEKKREIESGKDKKTELKRERDRNVEKGGELESDRGGEP